MLVPSLITLSTKVLAVKKNKELVSSSFIARFEGGTEKVLNKQGWQAIGLRKEEEGETVLGIKECCLYWRDWSNNPTFGTWDKNYPSEPIIPKDITDLM